MIRILLPIGLLITLTWSNAQVLPVTEEEYARHAKETQAFCKKDSPLCLAMKKTASFDVKCVYEFDFGDASFDASCPDYLKEALTLCGSTGETVAEKESLGETVDNATQNNVKVCKRIQYQIQKANQDFKE